MVFADKIIIMVMSTKYCCNLSIHKAMQIILY